MSFYNMLNGMNANLTVLVSAVLGLRIDEYFPRFRDLFTSADDAPWEADIFVYTRMGSGNRECWGDNEKDSAGNCLCPGCRAERIEAESWIVGSYDDDFDCTYRTFGVRFTPEQREQWEKIQKGEVSKTVMQKIKELYPKLFKPASSKPKGES